MVAQLLDFLLGNGHVALFRRAELKTLVDFHGNEVGTLKMFNMLFLFFILLFLLCRLLVSLHFRYVSCESFALLVMQGGLCGLLLVFSHTDPKIYSSTCFDQHLFLEHHQKFLLFIMIGYKTSPCTPSIGL